MLILFGILDIIAGIILIISKFKVLTIAWIFGIYLIAKGVIFLRSLVSIIDIVAGIILILTIYNINTFLTLIAALWLIQKGIFSLIR